MSDRIRIVVVDDHMMFRQGLVKILEEIPEFQVVGDADGGESAIKIVQETYPDVILLDVNMPGISGIETITILRKKKITAKIIMLTISKQDEDLFGAIEAGADGYLLKNAGADELSRAIKLVMNGQAFLSPEVTLPVLQVISKQHGEMTQEVQLSDREIEVLQCLASGQTTNQIGSLLFISENTVKTHIRHILDKLAASNRTEAVTKALRMGIIHK